MKNGEKCWVVGKSIAPTTEYHTQSGSSGRMVLANPETIRAWEFVGVFKTEADAVRHCLSSEYFVGPAIVGEAYPDATTKWVGAYYPIEPYWARGNAF